jgi:hypothetical protein
MKKHNSHLLTQIGIFERHDRLSNPHRSGGGVDLVDVPGVAAAAGHPRT